MAHSVDIHVGKMLRQRREICGMPQKELARRLGISFQQVQKYESGANRVSASKLWDICCILETEPGYYFAGLVHGQAQNTAGMAEAPASAYQPETASSRQVIDLNQSFQQIHDPKVRQRLVQLVRSLVQGNDDD